MNGHRLLLATAVVLSGCGTLEIPDLNNPSVESLTENPTPSAVRAAATGMLIGARSNFAAPNGYVVHLGILGRESYNFDAADPRFITEMLASPALNPGSPAFGGNFWNLQYLNIRNGHILLGALEKVAGFSAAETEAIRGYAKTIQALEFLMIINTRDSQGAPIDVNRPLGEELAPIEDKAAVLAHIVQLLEEAKVHLQAGGAEFPFGLSTGFAGFDTPATFLTFNRALLARVEAYRQNWAQVLTALSESFLDDTASLQLGVYHAYGTGSGDATNGLVSPNIYAHRSIVTDAELKLGGAVDDRVTRKVTTVEARTVQGLTSDLQFSLYPAGDSPVPIIRNEELILLRAEANIGLETLPPAVDDLNLIRVSSGGLEPRTDLDATNVVEELLQQRRYSLLFEGGHRWIDARRYGRLNTLPLDLPSHFVHAFFPIPEAETNARGG